MLLLQAYKKGWFAAINFCDDEALANLAKFSSSRVKVGLQYIVKIGGQMKGLNALIQWDIIDNHKQIKWMSGNVFKRSFFVKNNY